MKRLTMALMALGLLACGPPPPPSYGGAGGGSALRSGAKPAWVDGTSARYPRMQYLSGVGHGAGRATCESDARAAIAKVFRVRVQQVSQDWMGHFSKVNATGKIHVEAMTVSQLTRVSTDYVVKGVKIAEVWKGSGTFHCLAILERFPASRTLRDAIDKLDVEIGAKVSQGDKAANDTAKFFAYKGAMLLLQRREALNAELRIVSPTGAGRPPTHGWADLVAKFTGASSRIKIGLKLQGRNARKLQTCIAEQLTARHMQVTETSN
ncbi:MAG: LPP20 family lipoprotein, partial [Deltaproteobacteria bacterium]|nr:LPP20 family lipoprotein [Deltaproteobacteria bacterium]